MSVVPWIVWFSQASAMKPSIYCSSNEDDAMCSDPPPDPKPSVSVRWLIKRTIDYVYPVPKGYIWNTYKTVEGKTVEALNDDPGSPSKVASLPSPSPAETETSPSSKSSETETSPSSNSADEPVRQLRRVRYRQACTPPPRPCPRVVPPPRPRPCPRVVPPPKKLLKQKAEEAMSSAKPKGLGKPHVDSFSPEGEEDLVEVEVLVESDESEIGSHDSEVECFDWPDLWARSVKKEVSDLRGFWENQDWIQFGRIETRSFSMVLQCTVFQCRCFWNLWRTCHRFLTLWMPASTDSGCAIYGRQLCLFNQRPDLRFFFPLLVFWGDCLQYCMVLQCVPIPRNPWLVMLALCCSWNFDTS